MTLSTEVLITILIFLVIVIGGYLIFLLKVGEREKALLIIKELVDEAENRFGKGTGELKYNYVVERVQAILPAYIRLFITKKTLDRMITIAVDELQEHLEKEIKEEREVAE